MWSRSDSSSVTASWDSGSSAAFRLGQHRTFSELKNYAPNFAAAPDGPYSLPLAFAQGGLDLCFLLRRKVSIKDKLAARFSRTGMPRKPTRARNSPFHIQLQIAR
jgi:hypothetical protein